jgi:mono/diheme cytochrome c family protein
MSNRCLATTAVFAFALLCAGEAAAQTATGLGRAATASDIDTWGPMIGPDGAGLPPGGASAVEGRALYDRRCAACHGPTGTEGPDARLAGGQGSLATAQPRKTVGSYWPAATTLWDYVNRAMPFNQPGSLTTDEVYAAVAYVLFLNDLVGERDPVDAESLPRIRMPNRDGFVPDPRPDLAAVR